MSINNRINEIKDVFSIFDDPLDKYTEIIEFGKKNKNKYMIHTDSEAFIVKGLLSILEYVINDSTKKEIFSLSIIEILSKIGLDKSITSQRTNGFLNALNKIKEQINEYEK